MNEPQECLDITRRFFEALDLIKEQKRIRGLKSFAVKYGVNYWDFNTWQKKRSRIRQEWLAYLVRDFDVSALWLLTGEGPVFTKEIIPREKFSRSPIKKKTDNDTDKA